MEPADTTYNAMREHHALVPVRPGGAVNMCDLEAAGAPYWTSLDHRVPAERALIRKCLQNSDFCSDDYLGKAFPTQHVFCHMVEIADATTGEVVQATRLVLVDPQGSTLSFVSAGAVRSMRAVIATEGRPPWTTALGIITRAVKTRRGFRTFNLDIDDAPPQAAKPKKG